MQPSDNRPQDASAAQGVPPKDYAMLVLEDEDTEAYVADAQTVYVTETVLTKVYLLEGRFTDADLRAWCLGMQTRHVIPFQNAHIMTAWVSDDDWPDMSDYITHGWAMITRDEHAAIAVAVWAAMHGDHSEANRIMGRCRRLPPARS